MTENQDPIESRYALLQNILKCLGRVLIAFSGGVDSTLLLKVAANVLADDVVAVTALSETTPRREQADAIRFAKTLNVGHLLVETRELDIPEFVKNPDDKCYVCKKARFGDLVRLARSKGFSHVADGENMDDQQDYRPGSRAARELGIRSPLREAGLGKADIRLLSKQLNLPTYDKPAYACLASRIPYDTPITAEKLRQVDDGEEFLRGLGLAPQLRVRHYGDTARIELDAKDIPKAAEGRLRKHILTYFKALGFEFVSLDMEGYSMGSLNRAR